MQSPVVTAAPRGPSLRARLGTHWTTQELVTIGVFTAVIKVSTLLVAYLGGGMNPVTLMAKNGLFVMLMIVLLHKVPRTGTLTLASLITVLVSLLLMGQGILHTPGTLLACGVAEGVILLSGGYTRTRAIVWGVFTLELCAKLLSLAVSWLVLREQPGLLFMVAAFVAVGTVGSVLGLGLGVRFMKELRHAGIISHA